MSNPPSMVVDYVVDGARSAAAAARGETRLLGVVVHDGAQASFEPDAPKALSKYAGYVRVYDDAVFALCIETKYGFPQAENFTDTRLMLRLLDENVDIPQAMDQIANSLSAQEGQQAVWPDQRRTQQIERGRRRAIAIQNLVQRLPQDLEAEGLQAVCAGIENPIIRPTADMISNGMLIDFCALLELQSRWRRRLESARAAFLSAARRVVNPDSYVDVSQFLFRETGLPVATFTESGNPSISIPALERLMGLHNAIAPFRDYCVAKPVVYQLEAFSTRLRYGAQRITADIDPLGAVTGRFTCKNPNLQGMSSEVLPLLVADDGYLLIEADLSQTELRVFPAICNCSNPLGRGVPCPGMEPTPDHRPPPNHEMPILSSADAGGDARHLWGGEWLYCRVCTFAGDVFELAAQIWRTGTASAWERLAVESPPPALDAPEVYFWEGHS